MTTKVTVDAHAGWPVLVEAIDQFPSDAEPKTSVLATVPAKGVQEFYVHNTRSLLITELSTA